MKRKPSSLTTWNLSWTFTPTTSSARLGHHAGRDGKLAVRPQELAGLVERLVVTRVVVLHRPSERLRRDVRVQPPLLRHPNHGKVRTELAAKVAMADVHIASANAKSSNRADSKGFCFYRKISGRVGYKTASDASKWILFLMTSPPEPAARRRHDALSAHRLPTFRPRNFPSIQ